MKILKILAIILLIMVVAGVVLWSYSYLNGAGSTTLNSTGNVTKKALVVYDPGFSGAPKTVANSLAEDLKSKGYTVTLAGINSKDAGNVSGYNVLIVGGPTYAGNASSSVKSYLNNLNVDSNTTIGVFSVGDGADDQDSNIAMQQILQNKGIKVKVSIKYDKTAVPNDYKKYINQLLGMT